MSCIKTLQLGRRGGRLWTRFRLWSTVDAATDNMRDPSWYKQAIIYELPVKSFYDSNGDGIGDFPGLIEKLDYIESWA